MKLSKTLLTLGIVSAFVLTAATAPEKARQEEPFKPKNLKVLPKNITRNELDSVMKHWKDALGVKCGHCHSPSESNPKRLDFASDAKPQKDVARKMYKMTRSLNRKYFAEHSALVNRVACNTCHRGQTEPQDQLSASR